VDVEDPVADLVVDHVVDLAVDPVVDLVVDLVGEVIVNLVTIIQAQVGQQGLVVKQESPETS